VCCCIQDKAADFKGRYLAHSYQVYPFGDTNLEYLRQNTSISAGFRWSVRDEDWVAVDSDQFSDWYRGWHRLDAGPSNQFKAQVLVWLQPVNYQFDRQTIQRAKTGCKCSD
jgi:hypothetical protein